MTSLPAGTVTFLFTDIEGSTQRWEQHPAAMKAALAQHDALMRAAFAAEGGTVLQTAGDSFVAVFAQSGAALAAALAAQRALLAAPWPPPIGAIRVRAALHSGPGEQRADGYHAEFTLNRLARLLAAGHGGQVLVTGTTRGLLDGSLPPEVAWQDLGEVWLKDLISPLHVYQVTAPDLTHAFPPLRTLAAPGAAALADTGADAGDAVANPYKGLRAFGEADAPDFFGREELSERLLARLGETVPLARFLAVVGPSGSGKSSVVRAGVLPALRRGRLPGSEQWLLVEVIPGAEPLRELAAALGAASGQDPAALLDQLQADEYGLLHVAQQLLAAPDLNRKSKIENRKSELLLLIDQFEEVFTLVAEEPARVRFLETLHRAVTAPDSPVRVLVTLRADFYDRPLLYPDPGELVRQRTEVVLPLRPEELARAIAGPAERVGVRVAADLVAAVSQDVGEQPGTLPLVEYALTELFARRTGAGLTLAAYRAGGGLQAALGRRAEEIYASLSAPAQELARQVFLRLVTLGEGVEDTRRRVRRAELAALPVAADTLDGVLEAFSRYRLLTFDRDQSTHEATVEVAHEALIRSWGRLRAWLDAGRAAVAVQRQLGAVAAEWAGAGQEGSFLARGGRLAQFAALAASGDVALTAEERAYLAASEAEAERQAQAEQARQAKELELARQSAAESQRAAAAQRSAANRLRGLVAGLAVFLVIAAGLTLFALDRSSAAQANAAAADHGAATAVANRADADHNAATAVANKADADAQRLLAQDNAATAVANGAEAALQRQAAQGSAATAVADFRRADAQRLAAEANTLLVQGGRPELIALLAIRSMNLQYSSQGDGALAGAQGLVYPVQLFIGHNGPLSSAVFSPDGTYVLTAGADKMVQLWDAATGRQIRQFSGHTPGVNAVAFSPDGKWVLTGGQDNPAWLWDTTSGREVRQFTGHTNSVNAVAFSPDGKWVLTGSADQTARLWDTATGRQIRQFTGHMDQLRAVAFSPSGQYVLTASNDKTARLWDAATGQELRRFSGHALAVTGAVFSPDGQTILTISFDHTARLWDVRTGTQLRLFTGYTDQFFAGAFAPDGRTIAVGGQDDTARLWDVATGAELRRFVGHASSVNSLAFSPDGRQLLSTSSDGSARLWATQGPTGLPSFSGHTDVINDVAYSPDGKWVLTASNDQTARLWDAQTGTELRRFSHTDVVNFATFSADGKYVLSGSWDHTARLWDARTGAEIRRFLHPDAVNGVALSPDGKYVLTGGGRTDHAAHLWDIASGLDVRRFVGPPQGWYGVAFSPDGKYVVTGSSLDNTAWLWDAQSGAELRRFVGDTDIVYGVTFSPDSKYVLTGSNDNTARLWNVQSGAELLRFSHPASVWNVAFSPDGRYVLTGSDDKTARLWDARTGQELRRLNGHTATVYGVAFSPDGKHVLTGSGDWTARLWDTDYHTTIQSLCARLLRDLTADERAQFSITDPAPTCPAK